MRPGIKNIILISVMSILAGNILAQEPGENNYLIGKARLETGQYDSALVYLDKALEKNKNNPDASFSKGIALYHKSQFVMAIREFEKVEKTSPGKASIWIARCYANIRDTKNCLEALDIHLKSNYRLPESTLLLDHDLAKLENDPKYIEFWKNGNWYTGLDQTLAEAGYLIKSKQYPEAINILSDGLKKGYRKAPLYAKRSEVYLSVGNLRLALDDLNNSIEIDRRNPELLVKRAGILYVTGKYRPALDDYNAAVKLNPNELIYHVGRSMAYNKKGLYTEAVNDINIYLSYYPGNDTAWYQCGIIHFENGNYFEALNCFNKALQLGQHDARFFAARGATYLKTRTYQYAWKDLSMALDLNPKDSEVFVNKGLAALNIGNKDDACFCFEMAKKLGNKEAFNLSEKYCK
jgi:tetratricopeptide (TPR) repeat protein